MKSSFALIRWCLAFLSSGILLAGCKDEGAPPRGKIPFDTKKAMEHIIPVDLGSRYSSNFLNLRDSVLPRQVKDSSFLPTRFNLPIAETFNRHAIAALLNADGAEGVRVYFGNDDKGLVRLVLMPVDKDGKDIITTLVTDTSRANGDQPRTAAFREGQSVENGQRPPPPFDSLGGSN